MLAFFAGSSIRSLRSKERPKAENRLNKLRSLRCLEPRPVAEVPAILLGTEEQRLGEYKIPRRRRSEEGPGSPEKSNKIFRDDLPVDPRHENPAGLSTRRCYGERESNRDEKKKSNTDGKRESNRDGKRESSWDGTEESNLMFEKLVNIPEKSREEKSAGLKKIPVNQEKKDFMGFLSKKQSNQDRKKFNLFLDSRERFDV